MLQRVKLLIISPQVVQNDEPFKLLAGDPRLQLTVCYCSLPAQSLSGNDEYINRDVFEKTLPSGYDWRAPRNIAPAPRFSSFWGLINPAVVLLAKNAECVLVYGYAQLPMMFAIFAARIFG